MTSGFQNYTNHFSRCFQCRDYLKGPRIILQYDYFNCGRSFSGRKGVNLHHLINLICTTFQLPKMSWKLVSEPYKVKRRLNNYQERRFCWKPIFLSVDAKNIKQPKFWPNFVILEFSKVLSGLYMLWLPGSQKIDEKNSCS